MKYVYPAVFSEEKNNIYFVSFPDIKDCVTYGRGIADALEMAKDTLSMKMYDIERNGSKAPEPSDARKIFSGNNSFVNYVVADTIEYRKKISSKSVKKTLSVPEWLNDIAVSEGVNFSAVLQEALKKKLNIK